MAPEAREQNAPFKRRRPSRRQPSRDAKWLADSLSASTSTGPERVRAIFRAFDETLRVVERVAWEVREIAEQTSDVWQEVQGDDRTGGAGGSATFAAEGRFKLQRVAQTAWMLGQLATSYRAHSLRAAFTSRRSAGAALERLHEKNARRFYETSVTHGGAFLKVGQLLSARHDLLPKAWIHELSKLQDEVPALPTDLVVSTLEAELGRPVHEAFDRFEKNPIAAASIGQVHRARLPGGEEIAVKVQRPGIAELVEVDLDLLGVFIDSVRSMLPPADLDTIEEEIRSTLTRETDYALEGQMMKRLADFFEGHDDIVVPRPFDAYSSRRVLCSCFAEGRKITQVLDELVARRADGDQLASERLDRIMTLLLEAYVRMVLEAGVFQADPHPGNLLVTREDRLVILDFGATQPLSDTVRDRYLTLVVAFVSNDRETLTRSFEDLGFRTQSGKPDTLLMFAEALLAEMRDALAGGNFSWPTKDQLFERAAGLVRQTERDPVVRLPPEFVMIGRVFGTLGGLFMHYQPNIDYQRALMPVVKRAVLSKAS